MYEPLKYEKDKNVSSNHQPVTLTTAPIKTLRRVTPSETDLVENSQNSPDHGRHVKDRDETKSIYSESDTADYINHIMKGSGASVNYDKLREELLAATAAKAAKKENKQNETSFQSMASSVSVNSKNIQSVTGNSTSNLGAFHEFLKNQSNDPDISGIPQKAFYSSTSMLSSKIQKQNEGMGRSSMALNSIGLGSINKNPLMKSESKKPLQVADLEKSPDHTPLPSASKEQQEKKEMAEKALSKISHKLLELGFHALAAPLLTLSFNNQNHGLDEPQADALISCLTNLFTEYENRGATIQNLVNQISARPTQPDKQPTATDESASKIRALEAQVAQLAQDLEQKNYQTEKLQFEAKAKILREESTRNRNYAMLEAIKQQYYFDGPEMEPMLTTIIETYEEKLNRPQPVPLRQYNYKEDQSSYTTSLDESKSSPVNGNENNSQSNLEKQFMLLRQELKATQEERDLLNLQLLNEKKTWLEIDSNGVAMESTGTRLSTRERIARDKKLYQVKTGVKSRHLSSYEGHDAKDILTDVCKRLGITDFNNIISCVDKIQLVVKLIPQMEQFIREINAIIYAFNMNNLNRDHSPPNEAAIHTMKLSETLEIVRQWANIQIASKDQQNFVNDIHSMLNIRYSAGSFENCLAHLESILADNLRRHKDLPTVADCQLEVDHILGLFSISSPSLLKQRMNELYVFWAEVNDGLSKLRTSLKLESTVQPGRVLKLAFESITSNDVD